MIKEAIVLAGGLGTRLQHIVPNLPKPMADINGKPFLSYLFDYLIQQKIERVILSAGYKSQAIHDFFYHQYKSLELDYALEKEPLGTGGGIKYALSFASENTVAIFNGDTFFPVNLALINDFHKKHHSDLTIALKPLQNFDRYSEY